MNRLPVSDENLRRRSEWTEGKWVTLADGQAWSFPLPLLVPGYQDLANSGTRALIDNILSMLNTDRARHLLKDAAAGDMSSTLKVIGQAFAMYQIAFYLGSFLLQRNYDLTEVDCDRLMPFNFQLEELSDTRSRIHQATPEILAISNAVAASIGVDIGPELARITASN